MESILFQLVALGFVVLTLMICLGFYASSGISDPRLWHHVWLTVIAWFVFAILLSGRLFWGWRGRLAIRWCLAGVILLLLAFIIGYFKNV